MECRFFFFKCSIFTILLLLLCSNCGERNGSVGKKVECRLYWISDTYPKEMGNIKDIDMRYIRLHYLIINKTTDVYFLPIKKTIRFDNDSAYCSEMCAYIDNKPIVTWFSADTRWNGILKPYDSIHAEIKIPEWVLDSTKVNSKITLMELLKDFKVRYNGCPSDTIYSSFPIPQLYFTVNDTIAIHYRDSTSHLVR